MMNWNFPGILALGLLTGIPGCPANACQWDSLIEKEARKQGVPPDTAVLICHAESSGNPLAVGDQGNSRGLFQISRGTWTALTNLGWEKAFDPIANIRIATRYLSLARTSSTKELILFHQSGSKNWRKLNPKWTIKNQNRIYREIYRGKREP